jgi:hypothetical protein
LRSGLRKTAASGRSKSLARMDNSSKSGAGAIHSAARDTTCYRLPTRPKSSATYLGKLSNTPRGPTPEDGTKALASSSRRVTLRDTE